jgi:hypothetical protein
MRAVRAPILSSRAFVATVMPCARALTEPASMPAALVAFMTPTDWSCGVEGTFTVVMRPSVSATRSVNVPPTSTPRRTPSVRCRCSGRSCLVRKGIVIGEQWWARLLLPPSRDLRHGKCINVRGEFPNRLNGTPQLLRTIDAGRTCCRRLVRELVEQPTEFLRPCRFVHYRPSMTQLRARQNDISRRCHNTGAPNAPAGP